MKKKRTKEEEKIHEHNKIINRKMRGFSTRIKNRCAEFGLYLMQVQYNWLVDHPNTELPVKELNHEQTVEAWKIGLENYEENLE